MTLQQIIKEFNLLSVKVYINEHKEFAVSTVDYFKNSPVLNTIDKNILEKIYELDTHVCIEYCIDFETSFEIYHYDLDLALEEMYNLLKRN